MILLSLALAQPCPDLSETLGGATRWAAEPFTVEGTFTGTPPGRFVHYEGPQGAKTRYHYDVGSVKVVQEEGDAPLGRFLPLPAQGQEAACSWSMGEGGTVHREEGRPARVVGTRCDGTPWAIELLDWQDADGAPFPHRRVYRNDKGERFEQVVESVRRGVPEGAFAPEPHPSLTRLPSQPVPLIVRGERPYVAARLTGPAGQVSGEMLLDTGWTVPSISVHTAEALGLSVVEKEGPTATTDATGRRLRTRYTVLPTLQVGDAAWTDLFVRVDDFGPDRLGVLGNRAFRGTVLELRGQEGTVHWRTAGAKPIDGVEMSTCYGVASMPATVAGRLGEFNIDSGAFASLLWVPTEEDQDALVRETGGVRRAVGLDVASGKSEAKPLGPTDVTVAGHTLSNAEALAMVRTDSALDGVIGWGTLECFDVHLDFAHERAHFELVADPATCAVRPVDPEEVALQRLGRAMFRCLALGGAVLLLLVLLAVRWWRSR